MNAVMKEAQQNHSEKNTDLAVIEPKSLDKILVISDKIPDDFYENTEKYQRELEIAITYAKSLAHEINDEGRKMAKADAALIRKFAKQNKSFSMTIFNSLTDTVGKWKGLIYSKSVELESEADKIMSRFEAHEQEKLESITNLLKEQLASFRSEIGIKAEFKVKDVDLSNMVKLTGTLTEKGKLTAKAVSFIKAIVDGELAHQNKTENRLLIIANRCLYEDIKPPLTGVHLGADLYADDATFEATLNILVSAEIERRDQLKANITKQVVEEN